MALALLVGPANAGKVARLLDKYLEAIDREPFLVVPNRAEVDAVERDLLARSPSLLGGGIGTFDDLFERVLARAGADERPSLRELSRSLLLARVVANTQLTDVGAAAGFSGFAEALGDALDDLEAALIDPDELDGDTARLFDAYRVELDRVERWDRADRRRRAAELVAGNLDAWNGAPVFAYGFEDLTGAQWKLIEALAGRTEVCISLPYEAGRSAFSSLRRTAEDLAGLARGQIEELTPQGWYDSPALGHLERVLFEEKAREEPPPLDGAVRFLEAAGARAALELAGADILEFLRSGTPAEEIAVVAPSIERSRAPLEAVFTSLGIPFAVEGTVALGRTRFGQALLGVLRFAWLAGGRRDLYTFLRSPYSGLPRYRADFAEGRLRGRAVAEPGRVEEETRRLLGHGIPALDELRAAGGSIEGARAALRTMARAAYGLEGTAIGDTPRLDLRAHGVALDVLDEVEGWRDLGNELDRQAIVAALERARVRLAGTREPGRVAVLDVMRARTRRFRAVFVLGLEEGVFPRRSTESPFLPDERRAELEDARRGRRILRPDPLERDRYLFYTLCTRPWQRLTLVREAASDDGRPREPSPFYDAVRACFAPDDVARWTRRRLLSALVYDLDRAPTERERLRATAAIAATDEGEARGLANANGWERRIERALTAFSRPTRLANPRVLLELRERTRFPVTEVEQFGDCSSMWFFERVIEPKQIEAEVDPRLRGQIAHQALHRFYASLPKRLGVDQVDSERLEAALTIMRECLAEAIEGGAGRLDLSDVERLELEGTLARNLEQFLRQEAELGLPLVPRRFEVSFGTDRAPVELQRGLDLGGFTLSGKIDRIDVDPFSASGIVQDYKLGQAFSAASIDSERRLQIPLYILALRDLVGIEPLGGHYRGLSGKREARGLLRADVRETSVPGLAERDYLGEEEFWGKVERAREHAVGAVERMRRGDVTHDPRWGSCPQWCTLWSMCRVRRP
jgi:ATP-dependent helicase/DNAse subunit B